MVLRAHAWPVPQREVQALRRATRSSSAAEYPRNQVITKTDAAKYAVSWAQRPHLVSRGAQKNFVEFAKDVAERWEATPEEFNETYFRQLVGQAILYNEIRAAVAKADWYESGYLANIVTYTVAKLAAAVAATGSEEFDWGAVWQRQGISDATREFALRVAFKARNVLTDDERPVVNVTEWAKRDACWAAVRDLPIALPETHGRRPGRLVRPRRVNGGRRAPSRRSTTASNHRPRYLRSTRASGRSSSASARRSGC